MRTVEVQEAKTHLAALPAEVERGSTIAIARGPRTIAHLVPADFERFWDSKALWHAELEKTRPSTRNKLRTNLFLALRQSGMLADDATIISPLLSAEVSALLDARTPSDRRFFPVGGGL